MGSLPETKIDPEVLPELRQAFKVAEARTSGLGYLALSRETGFSSARIRLLTN